MRKIKQIAVAATQSTEHVGGFTVILALCEDGSLWLRDDVFPNYLEDRWTKLAPIPGTEETE